MYSKVVSSFFASTKLNPIFRKSGLSVCTISNTRSILNLRANYYEISNAKMLALKVTNFTLEILNITLYIAAIESIPIGLIGSSRN